MVLPRRSAMARCPIVDTWWQTETGGILITPLPGATRLKPGSATLPFFGVMPAIVDRRGQGARGRVQRQSRDPASVARPDAHGVRRSPALRGHLFQDLSGQVLHRRRRAARRGRLLLDHRSRRRRAERFRPPARHRRNRKRAGAAHSGGRGRGRGLPARHQGPGHLLLRHPEVGVQASDELRKELVAHGAQGNRRRSPRPT